MSDVDHIIDALLDILEEDDFPRTMRLQIETTIKTLEAGADGVVVSRCLQELESACDNSSLQSHHRMQLFNVVSLLETV